MSFKKPFVRNRTIDSKLRRRINSTQQVSKIDRRWQETYGRSPFSTPWLWMNIGRY